MRLIIATLGLAVVLGATPASAGATPVSPDAPVSSDVRFVMGPDDFGSGSRKLRLLGGSAAALAGLAVVAFLCIAGVVAWMFGVALPRHQDKIDDQALARARSAADQGQQRLGSAAADGKLTDAEVTAAVGSMWTIERSTDRWMVTALFPGGGKELCFRYDLSLPLGPDVRVTRTQLPDCPVIRPHTEVS